MNSKYKLISSFILVATGIALILADTAAYRSALANFTTEEMARALITQSKNITYDFNNYSECESLRVENKKTNTFDFKPEARACLISVMPKTKTAIGGIIFGNVAYMWLSKHPLDEEVRASALVAINNGRAEMISQKHQQYDKLQSIANAHDTSVLLKLFQGKQDTVNLFEKTATDLNRLEYAVMLPDVKQEQDAWLIKANSVKD